MSNVHKINQVYTKEYIENSIYNILIGNIKINFKGTLVAIIKFK